MTISFSEAKTFINRNIGQITSISVVKDGSKRGAKAPTSPSGVYIYASGFVTISGSPSGTLTITLQGGAPAWENAMTNEETTWYPTQAQIRMAQALIDHVKAMNCSIKNDKVSYDF